MDKNTPILKTFTIGVFLSILYMLSNFEMDLVTFLIKRFVFILLHHPVDCASVRKPRSSVTMDDMQHNSLLKQTSTFQQKHACPAAPHRAARRGRRGTKRAPQHGAGTSTMTDNSEK